MRIQLLIVLAMAGTASAQPELSPTVEPELEPTPAPDPAPPDPSPPPPPPVVIPLQPPPVALPPPAVVTYGAPPRGPKRVCIEGRIATYCKSIFVMELGYRGGVSYEGSFDLGVLVNRKRHAFGATIGWLWHEHRLAPGTRTEIAFTGKARYRRWISDDAGIDLGIGAGRFGMVAETALEYRDLIALTAGVNTFPVEFGRGVAGTVGIRLGTQGVLALAYVAASLLGGARR